MKDSPVVLILIAAFVILQLWGIVLNAQQANAPFLQLEQMNQQTEQMNQYWMQQMQQEMNSPLIQNPDGYRGQYPENYQQPYPNEYAPQYQDPYQDPYSTGDPWEQQPERND